MTESSRGLRGGNCRVCESRVAPGQKFCASCGTPVEQGTPPVVSSEPPLGSGDDESQRADLPMPGPQPSYAEFPPAPQPMYAGYPPPPGPPVGPPGGAPFAPFQPGYQPVDEPYPQSAVVAAVVMTVFMPFVSLVAALVLRSDEKRPSRRGQLKSWAIASGVWLATGWLLVIGLVGGLALVNGGSTGEVCVQTSQHGQSQDGLGTHVDNDSTCVHG